MTTENERSTDGIDRSAHLHPQNGRIPDRGLERAFSHHRNPPVFVVEDGDEKHETPLCPEVQGQKHYALCREDALYAYGENWCEKCRMHNVGPGWKDPRYRREGSA